MIDKKRNNQSNEHKKDIRFRILRKRSRNWTTEQD